jgi:23S rRNA pseudouridine1911/1915/1917 synthase
MAAWQRGARLVGAVNFISMSWLEHRIGADEAGLTVQEVATGKLGVSRRMIQRLTRSRGITLNRKPAQLSRKVAAGDLLGIRTSDQDESGLAPVEIPLAIVYEDDDLLVIDKPAGLLVHPVAPHHLRTLAHGIAHHFQRQNLQAKVRPVHRLDRDTSGLILIAKSAFAHQHLDRQLRERTLRRGYLALVLGTVEPDRGEIDAPIGRQTGSPALREVNAAGDDAVTRYEVVERLRKATAVALNLETGRTHQIRVHMRHVGHPLLGDAQYGGPRIAGLSRQALHAWKLELDQPRTGGRIELVAPPPPELDAAWRKLGGDPYKAAR